MVVTYNIGLLRKVNIITGYYAALRGARYRYRITVYIADINIRWTHIAAFDLTAFRVEIPAYIYSSDPSY